MRQFGPWPGLELLRTYQDGEGPLYLVAYGAVGSALGYPIDVLRFLTALVGVVTLAGFGLLLRPLGHLSPQTPLLLLVTPYFAVLSVLLMSDDVALALVLVGVGATALVVARPGFGWWLDALAVAGFVGAEYVRQYYAVSAACLVVYALVAALSGRPWRRPALIGVTSLLLLLPLLALWRGVLPDNAAIRGLHHADLGSRRNLVEFNIALVWLGLYVGPVVIFFQGLDLRRWLPRAALAGVVLSPVFFLAYPASMGTVRLVGLYSTFLSLGHLPRLALTVVLLVAWLWGILAAVVVVSSVVADRRPVPRMLALQLGAVVLSTILLTSRSTERYFIAAAPMAILTFAALMPMPLASRRLRWAVVVLQAVVVVVYGASKLSGN